MLNHISISARDPQRVANVLAELWNGIVLPFPPTPNSFFVLANDGRGSAVEVTPIDIVLKPGEQLPSETGTEALSEDYGAQFVKGEVVPDYVPTHLNINSHLSIDEIKAIGEREGWRTLFCDRGEGLFQLVELWIEDRFLLEVMTPEQTARYVEITDPAFIATMFGGEPEAVKPAENLNLIG
jgi:hypothetical protein